MCWLIDVKLKDGTLVANVAYDPDGFAARGGRLGCRLHRLT